VHDPPADTRPSWHPDPSGAHEYRWWDGEAWSHQVADEGTVFDERAGAAAGLQRRSSQDQWIDLGWKATGCGCGIPLIAIAIAFMIAIPVIDTSSSEFGELPPTIDVIFKTLIGIGVVVGMCGALIGLVTLVAIIHRGVRRRRDRRRERHRP